MTTTKTKKPAVKLIVGMTIDLKIKGKRYTGVLDQIFNPQFNRTKVEQYSFILIDKEEQPYARVAWYQQTDCKVLSDDLTKGQRIIKQWKSRHTK